ncbi:MAG: HlyD family secretion protein [Polyangiaceae bacterium]|nr:HlyD family secretion protein [Myxococcales bacterium]MCB9586117.1 HlyD family secretion protein [Polyangiaceae bacterium]MCB9606795.1 HlyD family secretion protein [Polyangiaceae bacterium]
MSAAPREAEVLGETESSGSQGRQPPAAPSRLSALRHPRVRRVLLGVVAALLAGAGLWWVRYRPYVTTDDARIAAPTVAVAADGVGGRVVKVLVREGERVEAGQALIQLDSDSERAQVLRAEASVKLAEANVAEAKTGLALERHLASASVSRAKATVHSAKAALLRTVHGPRNEELDQAKARVAAAKARVAEASRNFERTQSLLDQGASTQQSLDSARTTKESAEASLKAEQAGLDLLEEGSRPEDVSISRGQVALAEANLEEAGTGADKVALKKRQLDKAEAQLSSAKAELALAKLALDRTTLKSPTAGVVVRVQADPGEHLSTGQGAVTVVDIDHAYVAANVEETQSARLAEGQAVQVSVDEGGELRGHVDVVAQSAASAFALIPADNAAGNFTKVVQRIPIRVALDQNPRLAALRVGQSVELRIRVQ